MTVSKTIFDHDVTDPQRPRVIKKFVLQGRSHFCVRSVHRVREHGKMARMPLAIFQQTLIDRLPFCLPFLHSVMKMAVILCLTFSLFLNEGNVAFSHQPDPDHQSSLHWYEWGEAAFDRAQSEDKLILLDLTAVWCHACHVMDQTTYAHPQVLALLEENFITIRVDTDQRPDLEARYRSGGWPTTSVLMPTGEILFQANSLEPEVMAQLLQEIKELYDSEKEDLQQQAAQLLEDMRRRPQLNQSQKGALRPTLASHSVAMMKNEFDSVNGGFRHHPKFFEPEAIQLALSYGFLSMMWN